MTTKVQQSVVVFDKDITRNVTLKAGVTYVIAAEVHVRSGVKVTVADGVTILIRNGTIPRRTLTSSALIFDTGSSLSARNITFRAADSNNVVQAYAANGGVFFLGAFRAGTKDNVSSVVGGRPSSFVANSVTLSYLGRTDPLGGDGDNPARDDIDAISIIGVGTTEWRVRSVTSEFSGDDGFDVTNSSINLDRVTVVNPREDGLNISSSLVQIKLALTIAMSSARAADRELFDLEVDNGPARVVIARNAAVDLRGYWGSSYDDVQLASPDMPRPHAKVSRSFQWYEFTGILRKGFATVYSLKAD